MLCGVWLVHDLLLCGVWLVHDLLLCGVWLVHDMLLCVAWLVHDMLLCGAWLVHDLLLCGAWLVHDLFSTESRISAMQLLSLMCNTVVRLQTGAVPDALHGRDRTTPYIRIADCRGTVVCGARHASSVLYC